MALKAHLGLHSEVALLRDVAQVPKEVVEEAEVEEASPVEVEVEWTFPRSTVLIVRQLIKSGA